MSNEEYLICRRVCCVLKHPVRETLKGWLAVVLQGHAKQESVTRYGY